MTTKFRVRPVMTTSISLRVFLALYCSCSTLEIGENSRRELSYLIVFELRKSLINQGFLGERFQNDHKISSQPRYDRFDTSA